jgi:hypothetical protein
MKVLGSILLILGIMAAVRVMNSAPIPGNQAYDVGKRIGRGSAPYILMAIGLRLLLRRNPQDNRPTPSRVTHYQRPAAPAYAAMPVKVQCSCGQRYEFEVEPVAGRMPTPVNCPSCGADGTDAANASIAQTLAARTATPAWPAAPRRRFHPAVLIGIGAVGAILALLITAVLVRNFILRPRARPPRPASFPLEVARPNTPPMSRPGPGAPAGKSPPSKAGSLRDAAPVPPDATSVEVFWGGRWYQATILRRDGQRAFIHYEGWRSGFDEWVTPDRMRPKR